MSKSKSKSPEADVAKAVEPEPGVATPPADKSVVDTIEPGDEPETTAEVVTDPGIEVARRTNDTTAKSSEDYVRVFVLGFRGDWDAKAYDHEPNKGAVLRDALSLGLRPTGDVRFIGKTTHRDGKSRVLTYKVPVVPTALVAE